MTKNKFTQMLVALLCIVFVAVVGYGAVWSFIDAKEPKDTLLTVNDADFKNDEYTSVLYKEKGKDFKILNLTDMQFNDMDNEKNQGMVFNTVDALILREKPDLITLTGDNVWGFLEEYSLNMLIDYFDSWKIPWAPILGNHDGETIELGRADFCTYFGKSKYCLFKDGDPDVEGNGNYVVNIVEKTAVDEPTRKGEVGTLVYSLIFLDSHNESWHENHTGDFTQIAWYEKMVKRSKEIAGKDVPSSVFMHIPCPEFSTALELLRANDPSVSGYAIINEDPCYPDVNWGLFDKAVELGSTEAIFVGHDHINVSDILYRGIHLVYTVKTGDRCYYNEALNGGTRITLTDGGLKIECDYVEVTDELFQNREAAKTEELMQKGV